MACELRIALEAVDRADLGEQLRGRDRAAARELEQRRRERGGPLFELVVEVGDLAVERAAASDELACKPHLKLLVVADKPTADPLQVGRAGEHPQRYLVGRVELVEMPAQALVHAAALVDDRIAVIDEQFELAVGLLVRTGPAERRLPDRCPRGCPTFCVSGQSVSEVDFE